MKRTITAVPVIALAGGLAAGATYADDPPQLAVPAATRAQATARPSGPQADADTAREQAVMLLAQRSADSMGLQRAPTPAAEGSPAGVSLAVPSGGIGNVWAVRSAAEREARAIAAIEGVGSAAPAPAVGDPPSTPGLAPPAPAPAWRQPEGTPLPANPPATPKQPAGPVPGEHAQSRARGVDVHQLALSSLARHAARAMGQDTVRVLGLDAVEPTIETAVAMADTAPRAHTVTFQPDPVRRRAVTGDAVSTGARGGARPRHAQLTLVPPNGRLSSAYDDLIEEVARQHDVAPHLIKAVIKVESNFQPHARSPKGAVGLMQVMPATGRRFGAADLRDPRSNLSAGTQYLRWLLNRFDDDLTLVLAAYNAGEGAVEKYGRRIPPYAETQGYVTKVMAHLGLASGTGPAASLAASALGGNGADAGGSGAGPGGADPADPGTGRDAAAAKAAGGRAGKADGNARASRPRADATLRTVSNWMGALLTSSPRSAAPRAAADTAAAGAGAVTATGSPVEAATWTNLSAPEPRRTGPV